jgi:beta-ureidopropionase / N-carbamoyl-L-amino-acid hydrolase
VNLSKTMPTVMDERFLDALDESAEVHAKDKHVRMPSGAGHDAQVIGLKLPAAMMFVPSIGGISHHFTENTADADIVLGCQVFADAAAKILKGN